jgi:LytS/YehU family sensor histidine kinase
MNGLQRTIYGDTSVAKDSYFLPLTCLAGLVSTHLLRIVIKRGRWLELSGSKLALRYAVALAVMSFGLAILGFFLFGELPGKANRIEAFTIALLVNSSLIGAWMAIYFLTHFKEAFHLAESERAQLNEAYTRSQLEALTQQINPHFLFNALNTVRALIPADSREPRDAVTKLAGILRATLRSGQDVASSMAEEMEIVRDYLALQKLRFGDNLEVREDIDPRCLAGEIPPLLLLTIVENAVKHGVQCCEEQAVLTIEARLAYGMVTVAVESPSPTASALVDESLGIGLRNAQDRLRLAFGDEAKVLLSKDDPALTKCVLFFPMRERGRRPHR